MLLSHRSSFCRERIRSQRWRREQLQRWWGRSWWDSLLRKQITTFLSNKQTRDDQIKLINNDTEACMWSVFESMLIIIIFITISPEYSYCDCVFVLLYCFYSVLSLLDSVPQGNCLLLHWIRAKKELLIIIFMLLSVNILKKGIKFLLYFIINYLFLSKLTSL